MSAPRTAYERFNPYGRYQFNQLPECIHEYPGLTPGEKIVLSRLLGWARNGTPIEKSLRKLAAGCGLSMDQTRRYLHGLATKRFIEIEKQFGPDGSETVNRYHILRHPVFESAIPLADVQGAPLADVQGAPLADVQGAPLADVQGLYKERTTNKHICSSGDERVGDSKDTAAAAPPKPNGHSRELTAEQAEWFATWWARIWRAVAKKAAKESFRVHVQTPERFAEVMAATEAQRDELLARPVEKRPYPATWLDGERWEDGPSPAPRPAQRHESDYPEFDASAYEYPDDLETTA